jgi:hypothetical protein
MSTLRCGAAGKPISAFAVKSAGRERSSDHGSHRHQADKRLDVDRREGRPLGSAWRFQMRGMVGSSGGLLTDKPRPRDQTGGAYDLVSYRMPKGWIMVAEP